MKSIWEPEDWLEEELAPVRTLAETLRFGFLVGCRWLGIIVRGGLGSDSEATLDASLTAVDGQPALGTTLCPEPGVPAGELVVFGPGANEESLRVATDVVLGILRLRQDRREAVKKLQEVRAQLCSLADFHVRVSDKLDNDHELVDVLLSPLVEETRASGAFLYLVQDSGELAFLGQHGRGLRAGVRPEPQVLAAALSQLQKPPHEREREFQNMASERFRRLIVVPLRFGRQVEGLLCLVAGGGGLSNRDAEQVSLWTHELAWALHLRGEMLARRAGDRSTSVEARIAERIAGISRAAVQMRHEIVSAARSRRPVLLMGATGTGKELAARAIHDLSGRDGDYVAVDCPALAESLVESELFGHTKGAFTGAAERLGLLEAADRGTLFLDEIVDLWPHLQAKLLRVLESSEVRKLGATKSQPIDVRVIAACSRDLEQLVDEGKFRQDLYQRLNVLRVYLAPLRDRREDIQPLGSMFLDKVKRGEQLVGDLRISPQAWQSMEEYDWPGNIRELRNVIERAALNVHEAAVCAATRSSTSATILPKHLGLGGQTRPIVRSLAADNGLFDDLTAKRITFEEAVIRPFRQHDLTRDSVYPLLDTALERAKGSYKEAAKLLNVQKYQKFMDFLRNNRLRSESREP